MASFTRVRLSKMESPATGGVRLDKNPRELIPQEHVADVHGVTFQAAGTNDLNVYAYRRSDGALAFADALNPEVTLGQLIAAASGAGITALTGDVTTTGNSGSVAATVAQVGNASASSVASAANLLAASQNQRYVLAAPAGSNGVATFRLLQAADVTGLAASAIVDATNADNITTGHLALALLSGTGAAAGDVLTYVGGAWTSQALTAITALTGDVTTAGGTGSVGTSVAQVGGVAASIIAAAVNAIAGTRAAATVYAGPVSGADAAAAFRILAATDIPNLPASKITTGTFALSRLDPSGASSGDVISYNGTSFTVTTPAGGTVKSVDLSVPTSFLSTSGGPVTNIGTLAIALVNQSAQKVFAGPVSGGDATPTFRFLAAADIPSLPAGKITGLANSATVDATNATNITAGALALARLATSGASNGNVLTYNGTTATWAAPVTSGGTVTNVALSAPSTLFGVSGSPVTTSGTLALALVIQAANQVFAGPASGGSAAPGFRALAVADIPTLPASQISGLAASATTNALDAGNINAGILPTGRLSGAYTGITTVGTLTALTVTGDVTTGPTGRVVTNGFGGNKTTPNFGFAGTTSGFYGATNNIGISSNNVDVLTATSALLTLPLPSLFKQGLQLGGSSSGALTHNVPAAVTSYTLVWPAAQGSAGQVPVNDGSGNLSWQTPAVGGGSPSYPLTAPLSSDFNSANYSFAGATNSGLGRTNSNQTFINEFQSAGGIFLAINGAARWGVSNTALTAYVPITLLGSSSGSVSLASPAAPTAYTLTLPPTPGTSGQVFTTDGNGTASWTTPSTGGSGTNNNTAGSLVQREATSSAFFANVPGTQAGNASVTPGVANSGTVFQCVGGTGALVTATPVTTPANQYPTYTLMQGAVNGAQAIAAPVSGGVIGYHGVATTGNLKTTQVGASISLVAMQGTSNYLVKSLVGVWVDTSSNKVLAGTILGDANFTGSATTAATANALVMRDASSNIAAARLTLTNNLALARLSADPASDTSFAQFYVKTDDTPYYMTTGGVAYPIITTQGTTQIKAPNGLVTAPGIVFAGGNAGTGIYLNASARVAISANGAAVASFDAGVVNVTGTVQATTSLNGPYTLLSNSGSAAACSVRLTQAGTGFYSSATGTIDMAASGVNIATLTSSLFYTLVPTQVPALTVTGAASFSLTSTPAQFSGGIQVSGTAATPAYGFLNDNGGAGLALTVASYLQIRGPGNGQNAYIGNGSTYYGMGIGITPQTTINNALALSAALSIKESAAPATVTTYQHLYNDSTDKHLYANSPTYGKLCLTMSDRQSSIMATTQTMTVLQNNAIYVNDGSQAATAAVTLPATSTTTDQRVRVMQLTSSYGTVITAASGQTIQWDNQTSSTAGNVSAPATANGFSCELFLPKGKSTWILLGAPTYGGTDTLPATVTVN